MAAPGFFAFREDATVIARVPNVPIRCEIPSRTVRSAAYPTITSARYWHGDGSHGIC